MASRANWPVFPCSSPTASPLLPTRGHLALSSGTLLPGFQMSALAVLPSPADKLSYPGKLLYSLPVPPFSGFCRISSAMALNCVSCLPLPSLDYEST